MQKEPLVEILKLSIASNNFFSLKEIILTATSILIGGNLNKPL